VLKNSGISVKFVLFCPTTGGSVFKKPLSNPDTPYPKSRRKAFLHYFCDMIIIGETLLSDEIYLEKFVCDIDKCKGACCVEGDAGAPLLEGEKAILEKIVEKVKPYMLEKGIAAVETQGYWVTDIQNEPVTPLIDGGACAYAYFDDQGNAKCAIETAYYNDEIDFLKPLSCHLYPIRVTKHEYYDALNYHQWPICNCARKKGSKLNVRIFRFVKDALVRKYGEQWYEELDEYVKIAFENNQNRQDSK